jgi:hypothetical protein
VTAVGIAWVLFVPAASWLAHLDAGSAAGSQLETARDDARGRLLTLGAGLFAVGALIFTARNYTLSREGQVTERYSNAIEQLGSNRSDVCTGGIYALERLARDSARDHATVMEVLTAFVREQSHKQRPEEDNQSGTGVPLRTTRPDVQAAVSVIGRRDPRNDRRAVNLNSAKLTGANLTGAKLAGAKLNSADLTGADLTGADLTRAQLTDANLTGADLTAARLADAWLPGAKLNDADLTGAQLTGANLFNADLTGADLSFADLTSANLTSADLTRTTQLSHVYLTDAVWTDAVWPPDATRPPGWERESDSGRLAEIPSARQTVAETGPRWVRKYLFPTEPIVIAERMNPTAVPRWVRKYLFPTEPIVIAKRANPTALVTPIAWTLVGLFIAAVATADLPEIAGFVWIVWVLWALLFVWLGWRIVSWWRQYFVVTDHRMMLVGGVVKKRVEILPLTKVTDIKLHQTIFGRLFGYSEFIVQSAGQEQALSRIPFMPYPKEILKRILIPKTYSRR